MFICLFFRPLKIQVLHIHYGTLMMMYRWIKFWSIINSISMKKCGPSSLTPNLALGPPRRSSAIELSALSSSHTTSSNNTKPGGPGNLLLGNNLAGQYANLGSGSRSAATSPVAGVASTHNLSLASFGGNINYFTHSLIRGVLIQSCSARAKNFTNYEFCHPQFSNVIQNI